VSNAVAGLLTVGAGASVASASSQVTKAPTSPAVVEGQQGIINAMLNVKNTLNDLRLDVLACFTITNFLNKNHVKIGDIVAVKLLSNTRIRLFKRP
jgi:hypothetical protein